MSSDTLFNFLSFAVYAFIILAIISRTRFFNNLIGNETDGPALSSSELLANNALVSMAKGSIIGYNYNLMYNGGRVMAYIDLGYKTGIHVVATGDKTSVNTSILFSNKWLKPIELEGDFPSYFRMYCTPGKEVELLTIFEPETMAYFVDFCRSHNFEIYQDTLFISQGDRVTDTQDHTTMMSDIEAFLKSQDATLQRLKA